MKRIVLSVCAAVAAAASSAFADSVELITNGSFEGGDTTKLNSTFKHASFASLPGGWTGVSSGWAQPKTWYLNPPGPKDGTAAAYMQMGSSVISQEVTVVGAGLYRAQFFAVARSSTQNGLNLLAKIDPGTTDEVTVITATEIADASVWTLLSGDVSLQPGKHVFAIFGQQNDNKDRCVAVDCVSLAPAPGATVLFPVSLTNSLGEAVLSLDGGSTWFVGMDGWFELGSELTVTLREDVRRMMELTGQGVTVRDDGSYATTVTAAGLSLVATLQENGTRRWNEDYTGYEYRVTVTNRSGGAVMTDSNGESSEHLLVAWVAPGASYGVTVADAENRHVGWMNLPPGATNGERGLSVTMPSITKGWDVRAETFTPTHVWTGAASTDFASAANWTNATADAAVAAPNVGDDVFIPVGCANQPTAATPFSVRSFRIGRLAGESGTATFTANTVQTNVVSGDVVVYAGGVLTHTGPENVPTKKLNLLVGGDMAVHADGRLDVRGKGYNHKQWPGSGLSQNGGRHASSHGSAICPVTHGGGGGKDQDGRGSGVVYANVSGTLTIDGEITADYYVDNPFCGSGGSIQLHAGSYAGKGFVTANGAKGTGSDSADGGRIALYVGVDGDEFAGTVTAYGGGPDATRPGACGTVYRCREGERGHLLLDAEGRKYVKVTPLADFVFGGSDFRLASLTVTNGASAALKEGMTLRVTELWDTRGGTMAFEANSHVVFEPSATGRVHGVNAFWDVSCAATGKALAFGTGAGEVTSVQDGGSCDFHGAADAALALLPDGEGVWSIGVSKLAACVLDYLAVSNSDASAGMSLTARSSADLGGNNYWSFPQPILPGDVIEWTGASSGDWSDPANWKDKYNQPRTPEGTDHVIIPSECANSPTVNAAMLTLNSVTVSNGAHLVLQSSSVTVTNALTVNGALGVSGGGILTCCGNVLFAKASSLDVDASSVLSLAGDFEQAVSAPGVAFSSLRVQKTGGLVMFAKGFSAQELRANVSTAPVQLLFGAGEAFAVRDLFLMGELGGAAGLTLSSSESGAAWYLNATGIRHVSAVSVSDSDASGGKVIAADALSAGPDARNVNWTFSGSSKFWTGAVDTAFENGANWSPVGAPDAGANVLVTPARGESLTLSITKPTHVASFTLVSEDGTVKLDVSAAVNVTGETKIGGDVTVTMKTEDLWTTGGDFSLEDGAVFTHDGPLNPPKYRAGISAGGSITIAAGAHVTADGKGRVPKSAYWGTIWNTGSHGGKAEQRCYGSVFQPVLHGSCGGNQNTGHYAYGGGVVRLIAEGDVTVAGEVSANGLYDSFSGAGGSIWITCGGALKGSGIIRAIGGMYATSNQSYCGAGGRISVMQGAKVREFGGLLSARACLAGDGAASGGGAGTVYFSCGGQPLAGDLLLSNNGYAVLATQLPMADDGDSTRVYRDVSVTVTNGAVLEVTGPLTVKDVDLAHAKSRIDLGTNTLTIISHDHKNGKHWANGAKVTCTTNAATGVYGKIVWKPCGFALIVR